MARPIVAFDYDGTLIDAFEAKRESYWRAVAETLGLGPEHRPIVDASYARTSGANRFDQFADTVRALGRNAAEAHRQEFSRLYSHYNEAFKERMREFPSVRPVLEALRRRFDLALISGLLHDLLLADARARGLAGFFDVIEGGDKGRALEAWRNAGRVTRVFVGDTPHDEAVARAHGVPFFLVRGDDDLRRLRDTLLAEEQAAEVPMDILEIIRTRRSVAQFTPDPVPRETIEELLEAAIWTPNHRLTEPWQFFVLGPESKRRFAEIRREARREGLPNPDAPEAQPALRKLYDATVNTPVIIVITSAGHDDPEIREENEWATFAATYAIMLGGWSKGIGTYFRTGRGVLGSPELRMMLDLPAGHRIIGVLYAGYPAAVPQKKRTPAVEKTVWLP